MTDIWLRLHGTQWSVSQVPFHTKHCAISHATLCYLACNTVRSCTQTLCFLSYVMHSAISHAVLCILSCLEHSAILHASLCGLIRNTLQSDLRRALQLHRPKHQFWKVSLAAFTFTFAASSAAAFSRADASGFLLCGDLALDCCCDALPSELLLGLMASERTCTECRGIVLYAVWLLQSKVQGHTAIPDKQTDGRHESTQVSCCVARARCELSHRLPGIQCALSRPPVRSKYLPCDHDPPILSFL